jgi:CRP/FNR family cyclic AMP-dependent transcriptional regulator
MAMSKKQKADLLRRVELFEGVSTRALNLIADAAVDIEVPAGKHIVRQGQIGTGFYLISSGRVRVIRGNETLATLGPGEFFGELSVLDQAPRMAHVIAEEPTVCLALASWDFVRILEQNPKAALSVLRVMAKRLRAAEDHPGH